MAVNTSRAHPTKELPGGIAAIPTALTVVSTTVTFLEQLYISNPTAGALTVLVTDTAGVAIYPTISCPANAVQEVNWPSLLKSTGVKWQASGSGLVGEIFGYITG